MCKGFQGGGDLAFEFIRFHTHDTVVDPAGVMVDVDPDHHQRLDRDDGAPQLTAQLAVNLEGNYMTGAGFADPYEETS